MICTVVNMSLTYLNQKAFSRGKINECPDCVEELGTETAVKYLGCASADGKMGGISILAFDTDEARENYRTAWNNNNGMHKEKSLHCPALIPL